MNTIEKLIAQHDKMLGRQELKTCKIYADLYKNEDNKSK